MTLCAISVCMDVPKISTMYDPRCRQVTPDQGPIGYVDGFFLGVTWFVSQNWIQATTIPTSTIWPSGTSILASYSQALGLAAGIHVSLPFTLLYLFPYLCSSLLWGFSESTRFSFIPFVVKGVVPNRYCVQQHNHNCQHAVKFGITLAALHHLTSTFPAFDSKLK